MCSLPDLSGYINIMTQSNDQDPNMLGRATDEIKGMGREGLSHPSTKPVLGGAVIGAKIWKS